MFSTSNKLMGNYLFVFVAAGIISSFAQVFIESHYNNKEYDVLNTPGV